MRQSSFERGIPVLQDIERIELEEDMIVGGRVSQPEVLSDLLEDALSEGTYPKKSISRFHAKHSIRKITSLPDIGEKELAKLLQFEVGERIHSPFDILIYYFVQILHRYDQILWKGALKSKKTLYH